jgi:response regulator RpfG family c-di-GMP phosphodiesterase
VAFAAGLDALVAAWTRSARDRSPYLTSLRDEVGALFGIGTAIGATGILIALASAVMGIWALPVLAIPLVIAQFSLRRFAVIRQTHRQTIQALSRVTEVGGYTDAGHSWRVSELSKAVGRELGLTAHDLFDLEQAALMHDIGQLSLPDPIPGGATTMASGEEQRAIAERGAEVIRATGALDRVADIVACQAEPYRRPGEPVDASIPLASRIIRVVNAYDDLAGGSLSSERRLDALDQLRLNMAYDYDPTIVDCLTRVVGRTTFSNV